MLTTIQNLPDNSRIWIFPADRKLSPAESSELLALLDSYLTGWEAHHVPVSASRELKYDQFVIIAADPQVTAPSGCSIDDMTRAIKSLSQKFGVDFFNPMKVFYRVRGEVNVVSRAEFKTLAANSEVDASTIVFDNSLVTLGSYRSGKWEIAAGQSWHKALLPQAVVV